MPKSYNLHPIRKATPPSQRLLQLDGREFPGCGLSSQTAWWQAMDNKGQIIAYTALEIWTGGVGFLARSWVHPRHRGHGIQRRLIRVRERYAKRAGFKKLVSYTSNDNCPSANSLIRCGYKTYTPQEAWGLDGCTYWFKVFRR